MHITGPADRPFEPLEDNPRKIVVVDDNTATAEALGAHLQTAGHEVMVAHTGTEAWRICKLFAPSAMIVDIGMPRLNGFQLARRIRRTTWGIRTLLIAVTDWAKDGDMELAKFVGFNHYFKTPVDFVEIESLVR